MTGPTSKTPNQPEWPKPGKPEAPPVVLLSYVPENCPWMAMLSASQMAGRVPKVTQLVEPEAIFDVSGVPGATTTLPRPTPGPVKPPTAEPLYCLFQSAHRPTENHGWGGGGAGATGATAFPSFDIPGAAAGSEWYHGPAR